MKTIPKNLWVYNRADSKLSLREYIRGKAHCIVPPLNPSDSHAIERVKALLSIYVRANRRPIHLQGQPAPEWLITMVARINQVEAPQ